ncbi:MAG: Uma2 family endonuclease, partial [Myxococcota bacterium]
MAADPAEKHASYADILALEPHLVGEIVKGVLYTHARPRSRHARASSRIGHRLGPPFDEGKGG